MRAIPAWFSTPGGKNALKWLNIMLSVIILVILARAISNIGWGQIWAILPSGPLFYLLFAAAYLIGPVWDWLVYRRWWPIGWRSLGIFLRKRVMNEALFSYSGDTYLLVWIGRVLGIKYDPDAPAAPLLGRGNGPGADPRQRPFAAIKDMAITSGLAGNLVTFFTLVLTVALGGGAIMSQTLDNDVIRIIALVFGGLLLLNIAIVLFAKQVMSLPRRINIRLFGLHLMRVILGHIFIVASWAVALPAIGIRNWIMLGAMRMVIARLPLPNKELLFAAIAASVVGGSSLAIAALMAAQGAMHIAGHCIAYVAAAAIMASGAPTPKPAESDAA